MNGQQLNKAIAEQVQTFYVGAVNIDGASGIAVVDKSGEPYAVTVVAIGAGDPVGGRFSIGADKFNAAKLSDLVANAVSGGEFRRDFKFSSALSYLGLRGGTAEFATSFANRFSIKNGGVEGAFDACVQTAQAMLQAGGLADLQSRINIDAISSLDCVSTFDTSAYAFYAQEGERGLIRRQAAAAYPFLAGEIALRFRVKMAVDQKKSPADALMTAFGVDDAGNPKLSKAILKKLSGKRYRDNGVLPATVIESLSRVPADWFPRDEAEWNAFVDLSDTFFRRLGPDFGGKLDAMIAGVGGKWVDFAYRIAKAAAETMPPDDLDPEAAAAWKPSIDPSREGLSGSAENAKDVIMAFRNLILLPMMANSGGGVPVYLGPEQLQLASDAAAEILFGGKSLPAIMELTRHWHTQAHNILEATGREEVVRGAQRTVADDGWAPICDSWVAPNGVTLFPLTDPREIKDEGAGGVGHPGPDRNGIMGLGHCVGGYSQKCRQGDSHIVSLRLVESEGVFKRLSTVEFKAIDPDSDQLQVNQHHGAGNGAAPAAAKEALAWFMAEVAEKRIPINRDGVMSYLAGRRRSVEEVEAYSGYDWRETEIIDAALVPWDQYLPKRLRGAGREDLQALPELRDLMESMVPTYSNAIYRQA